jgi:hypothetical protein
MSIIKLLWKTICLLVCSIIRVFGVLIEGIAKILLRTAKLLEKAHDRVLDGSDLKEKKTKEVHIDVAL